MANGLLEQSLEGMQNATTGLGEAALNDSRKFISDIKARAAVQSGIGEVAGLGLGYAAMKKSPQKGSIGGKPGVPSTPSQDAGNDGPMSGISMMLGTLGQKILPGFLKNRQQTGITESTAAPPLSADVGLGQDNY